MNLADVENSLRNAKLEAEKAQQACADLEEQFRQLKLTRFEKLATTQTKAFMVLRDHEDSHSDNDYASTRFYIYYGPVPDSFLEAKLVIYRYDHVYLDEIEVPNAKRAVDDLIKEVVERNWQVSVKDLGDVPLYLDYTHT
jgi:hypothetical protein